MRSTIEDCITQLNLLGERVGGYTTKTYNLLGCALLLKNDVNKATQIFQAAIDELKLDTEEGQAILASPNRDLGCLLYNYIKCLLLKNGNG